jgi:hypothetical protein
MSVDPRDLPPAHELELGEHATELLRRLDSRTARFGVIGLG